MLRAVGVPVVVVSGYGGRGVNPYGNYFLVRQSDAHSWVEPTSRAQWQVFDPNAGGRAGRA